MTDHTLPERLRDRRQMLDTIVRLKALLSRATPLPWPNKALAHNNAADARLIVEAVNALPALLDALDRLSADRDAVVAWLRAQKDPEGRPYAGLPAVANAIERGDHLPQTEEKDAAKWFLERSEHLPDSSPPVGPLVEFMRGAGYTDFGHVGDYEGWSAEQTAVHFLTEYLTEFHPAEWPVPVPLAVQENR